jgi:predicted dehydrogenase
MHIIKRVVVVGLGNIALRHRRNLKSLFPEIFIIAVPSSGKITSQNVEFADQIVLSLDKVIREGVDMAIVASPATFHVLHSKPLLLAGIPTLIEKPVTSNLQDAHELIKICKNTHTPTAVGYCLRYMPSSIKIKELLNQKIIGNIYNVFVDIGQYLPDWRPSKDYRNSVSAKISLGGGALLELSHEIDYVQWMLGPMEVQYSQLRSSSELNLEVEELADFVLVSDSGTVCNMHLDFLQKDARRTCSFIGEKGRIDWNLLTNSIVLSTKDNSVILFEEKDWDSNQMYLSLLKDFLNLIKGYKNRCVDLMEAATTVQMIEDIKKHAILRVKQ